MRILRNVPVLLVVIAVYNIFALAVGQMDAESTLFSWVLPSGVELFFKAGDVFTVAGLVALFIEVLKSARPTSSTIVEHMLSTATFIVALVEFILVPGCGTIAFFLLMVMTLVDVVAGYTISILSARRDYSISRDGGI